MDKKKIKPLYKPKKDLSLLQKRLLKEHSKYHSKKHINEMKLLMKKGFCFQQSDDLAQKKVGK